MNLISKVINKTNETVPIWFMRQAGRYLPEYKEVRRNTGNFLDLCYNPSKAAEVTLQPITRFDFDGAIIFSDILVLPHALGWDVRFEEQVGPILRQFKTEQDFTCLNNSNKDCLQKVYEAISIVSSKLAKDKFLIGFAGSPWTVMSYMLEGRGKQDFSVSKKFIYQQRELAKKLLDIITEETTIHLVNQVTAGCNVIKLFDSWSGILSENEYREFVIEPTKKIIFSIREKLPDVPIIGFPRGSNFLYEKYIEETKIDVVAVDQFIPISEMCRWQKNITVQGNLDPVILLTNKQIIAKYTDYILSNVSSKNYIFNLGHGVLPTTPIENVEFLIDYVRKFYQ
ncbi:MAG: uroporphyrinogen decarboxylase [Rickettsiaceae bacterium]|nr:MAG: uroporphyrinogen decarboxylase [Rickettsiaceae bacterium]